MSSKKLVNIKDACQLTGVASVTLRAWERRYGLIKPSRTPKGHRLYSKENIEEIRQIVNWLERGVAISKVAELLKNPGTPVDRSSGQEVWQQLQQELSNEVSSHKQQGLDQLLARINKSMPFLTLCEKVYEPLIEQLRISWQSKHYGSQLERQIWHQSWLRQITIMTLRSEKQKPRAKCWLINLDTQAASSEFWLFYALLLQSGFHISAITQLDDLRALPRLKKSNDQPVIMFGNQKLSQQHLNQLVKAQPLWNEEMFVTGRTVEIHQDVLSNNKIKSVGGAVSSCWQSDCYQAWLDRVVSV